MKIIPAIDLMDGKVVRLFQGDPKKKTVYSDNPIKIAKKWEKAGADMIHLVDLDATLGIGSNFLLVKQILTEISIPVQLAGGLRNEEKIDEAAKLASRVVIGTLAFQNSDSLKLLLDKYGSEKIVISVDHKDGLIVINGWQTITETALIFGIQNFVKMGFSEFLVTNVSVDGTLRGPDLRFLKEVCQLKRANVIASGGISSQNDIINVKKCNPFGVILGKALYENMVSIEEAKIL